MKSSINLKNDLQKDENYRYVKTCGITSLEDAQLCIDQGADMLGMVFHVNSKRKCDLKEALKIKSKFMSKPRVLVFGHDDINMILDIYMNFKDMLTFIQIPNDHISFEVLKSSLGSVRILPSISVSKAIKEEDLVKYKDHSLLIMDTPSAMGGGSGEVFNWSFVSNIKRPFLLAGGLNPENICLALKETNVLGFDLASGLESDKKNIVKKDKKKVIDFFKKVRNNGCIET